MACSLFRRQAITSTNVGLLLLRPLYKETRANFWSNDSCFHSRKYIWKCPLQNVVYFVSASVLGLYKVYKMENTESQQPWKNNDADLNVKKKKIEKDFWNLKYKYNTKDTTIIDHTYIYARTCTHTRANTRAHA